MNSDETRNRPNRVSDALYQSGYLLMFAYFGYEFIYDELYAKLREQILKPDEDILPVSSDLPPEAWANDTVPVTQPRAIMLVKEPASFIMPIFRLRLHGGCERVIGLSLPGLDNTTWPTLRPKKKVKGALVRFRIKNDDGTRPGFRDLWERAKRMS